MVILNITSQVDSLYESKWMTWLQNKYIPKVLTFGNFTKIEVLKLIQDDLDPTFAIQHKAKSIEDINKFITSFPSFYQNWVREEFQEKVLSFETELELISQYP
ncbi:MAG: DUF4286 family protein [Flavobacteriaceae bacterium]